MAVLVMPFGGASSSDTILPGSARTYAGGVGDGGPANKGRVYTPTAVAVEKNSGDVYLADSGNNRIRKIDSRGIITTVAGNGYGGYLGDNVQATRTALNGPFGIAVDGVGNLYVADTSNHRIRKVDTWGIITTIAGSGTKGYSGDGGRATKAKISQPYGIALDRVGNVFFADSGNNRIRKIEITSGEISTVAGDGVQGYRGDGGPATRARLFLPSGIAVDRDDNVFVADLGNNRVRKIGTTGTITTVAGTGVAGFSGDGGSPRRARLFYPTGVALDGFGNLFIADFVNNRVRLIDATGKMSTVAGSGARGFVGDGGPATRGALDGPFGVGAGDRKLYIADAANNRIRLVDADLKLSSVAGNGADGYSGDGGPATTARVLQPFALAFDPAGALTIADSGMNRIRRVSPTGTIGTVAGVKARGSRGDGYQARAAELGAPRGVAVDRRGNVYIADTTNHKIRRVDRRGIITTIAGTGVGGFSGDGRAAQRAKLFYPMSVAVDASGNVYVADTGNNRIRRIDARGIIRTFAGTGVGGFSGDAGPGRLAKLNLPMGITLDAQGALYIADTANHRVRRVAGGVITTVAGTGDPGYTGDGSAAALARLAAPRGVAVDTDGNVYIADTFNHRVRKVAPSGAISTIAGTGVPGVPEEGLPAALSVLTFPSAVIVDGLGTVYISDTGANRVIRIEAPAVR